MDVKQEMLYCVLNNSDFIMRRSDHTIIPYCDLDNSTISRIKEYFSYDISSDDIVALISTSVFDPGKTGIVFTTSCVYTRDWGFFPDTDENYLWNAENATFSSSNDFEPGVLRTVMQELSEILMNALLGDFKDVADATKDIAKGFKNLFNALDNLGN